MEHELISKKELLHTYKISYGALYRWKRMGLIPEDWFIKKSAVTGQETFFPKGLICERIELIKEQKDDVSLKELSKQISAKAKKDTALVIETTFGKKIFYFDDIKSITIDNRDGTMHDITIDIMGSEQ